MNIILPVLSGLLLAASFPKFSLWPLAFVTLVPFYYALIKSETTREALACGLLFGLAIVRRATGKLNVEADEGGIEEIARRARGTPRVALRLMRRVRDYAQVRADGTVTRAVANEALDLLQVDPLGLDDLDRRVLKTVIQKYNGGPVGLNTIAAAISEEPETIMDVVEPYLLQLGFLDRTPQGRVATKAAYEHLGVEYNEQTQPRLL